MALGIPRSSTIEPTIARANAGTEKDIEQARCAGKPSRDCAVAGATSAAVSSAECIRAMSYSPSSPTSEEIGGGQGTLVAP